ncbi:type IV pilus modification protein PilV [Ectothiorhodospira mobilis]|uniref:type IV pilus modification protein PilV n=1 Tax=Ectothiorhodospira mobilis TaxID=195064 RepID=UPI0019044095|nr:type IV pilus modification protein PilV [Ectothiorhodospira mobilis]MBK1691998.1 type IV pilus modification protein PilV [Ectothiorhodospira mobilis]
MQAHRSRIPPFQRGFSLTEVLVALLVLSVGLLGIAGLHLLGIQSIHSAQQRTLASVMAREAAERLWISLAVDGTPDPRSVEGPWRTAWGAPGNDAPAALRLPGITGSDIDCDGAAPTTCTIRVRWAEGRFAREGDEAVFEYTVTLPGGAGS